MQSDKPIVWLKGELKTPPLSEAARIQAGLLLRRLQKGQMLSLPQSRPMPVIGSQCHELRIPDRDLTWRIVYHLSGDAVVVLDVFCKKTQATPETVIANCKKRLAEYRRIESRGF